MDDAKKKQLNKDLNAIERFIIKVITVVLCVWVVFTFLFGLFVNSGEAMYPAIRDGDILLTYRLERKYKVGDVVTCKVDGERVTGRIEAVAGDSVDINEDNELMVNGNVQTDNVFFSTMKDGSSITYPYTVPEGEVFLVNDYREQLSDSRVYGAVQISRLDGKVISVVRRRGI